MHVFPSHMFYEDVMRTASHPTIDKLVWRYGHKPSDWKWIWEDSMNTDLRARRATPADMKPGDVLYIPIRGASSARR